jgi:hypothetical protein
MAERPKSLDELRAQIISSALQQIFEAGNPLGREKIISIATRSPRRLNSLLGTCNMDSDKLHGVISTLADYASSPSLRHIRNPHSLQKLAREIVKTLDRASSVWSKWEGDREAIAKAAACCGIPAEDLPINRKSAVLRHFNKRPGRHPNRRKQR